jgi:hypothetical protein
MSIRENRGQLRRQRAIKGTEGRRGAEGRRGVGGRREGRGP